MKPLQTLPNNTPALATTEDLVEHFRQSALAESTLRAYRACLMAYGAFFRMHDDGSIGALWDPAPKILAGFLAHQAAQGLSVATLGKRLAALRWFLGRRDSAHLLKHEIVVETFKGIRRELGAASAGKAPLVAELIEALVGQCDRSTLKGLRDRALLLFGFSGAFRRSELVAVAVEDLEPMGDGLIVHIRRSKTDQEGRGTTKPIAENRLLPLTALRAWMEAAEIETGPVFRRMRRGDRVTEQAMTPQSVALTIKHYAEQAGLEPNLYAGHSLRSGFLTSAARGRARPEKMMRVSGHKSLATLSKYIRPVEDFEDHAGMVI